jgi:hypothetical protein
VEFADGTIDAKIAIDVGAGSMIVADQARPAGRRADRVIE